MPRYIYTHPIIAHYIRMDKEDARRRAPRRGILTKEKPMPKLKRGQQDNRVELTFVNSYRTPPPTQAQVEMAVAAFLARGGQIERLPDAMPARPTAYAANPATGYTVPGGMGLL